MLSSSCPHRRALAAVGAVLASALALVVPLTPASPATAAAGDGLWTSAGTGTVTTVSDGSAAAAQMSYDVEGSTSGSWTFTTTATADGTVTVPYSWQGLHAWFLVTARLDVIVNGATTRTLVDDGPVSCCARPSNGFVYGGVETFHVSAGDTYGFRLSGTNEDSNDFLRGTFTLSTKPYLDATIGTDNRQWSGAKVLGANAATDGSLSATGETRWYKIPVVPGQQVQVDLSSLPADYDVAVYGDIGAAFDRLGSGWGGDLSQLAAASSQSRPGSGSQVPDYPAAVTDIPTSLRTPQFAPHIYAPHIYAPSVEAPSNYAPHIYAPHIYAPHIYAPRPTTRASRAPPTSAGPSPRPRTRPCSRCRPTPAPAPRP